MFSFANPTVISDVRAARRSRTLPCKHVIYDAGCGLYGKSEVLAGLMPEASRHTRRQAGVQLVALATLVTVVSPDREQAP